MAFLGWGCCCSFSSLVVVPDSSVFLSLLLALPLGVVVGVACSYIVRNDHGTTREKESI